MRSASGSSGSTNRVSAELVCTHANLPLCRGRQRRFESAPPKRYFKRIFELELEAWHTDPVDWPKTRDYPTFCQWFAVEADSLIVDLEDRLLEREDI
jgi:hypothetical protein